jgi:hypothetical protein
LNKSIILLILTVSAVSLCISKIPKLDNRKADIVVLKDDFTSFKTVNERSASAELTGTVKKIRIIPQT